MIAPVQGRVGQPVTFEGYADDYGNHIVALEFSSTAVKPGPCKTRATQTPTS